LVALNARSVAIIFAEELGIDSGWKPEHLRTLKDIGASKCCYYFHVLRIQCEDRDLFTLLKNIENVEEVDEFVSVRWSLPNSDGEVRRNGIALVVIGHT